MLPSVMPLRSLRTGGISSSRLGLLHAQWSRHTADASCKVVAYHHAHRVLAWLQLQIADIRHSTRAGASITTITISVNSSAARPTTQASTTCSPTTPRVQGRLGGTNLM